MGVPIGHSQIQKGHPMGAPNGRSHSYWALPFLGVDPSKAYLPRVGVRPLRPFRGGSLRCMLRENAASSRWLSIALWCSSGFPSVCFRKVLEESISSIWASIAPRCTKKRGINYLTNWYVIVFSNSFHQCNPVFSYSIMSLRTQANAWNKRQVSDLRLTNKIIEGGEGGDPYLWRSSEPCSHPKSASLTNLV